MRPNRDKWVSEYERAHNLGPGAAASSPAAVGLTVRPLGDGHLSAVTRQRSQLPPGPTRDLRTCRNVAETLPSPRLLGAPAHRFLSFPRHPQFKIRASGFRRNRPASPVAGRVCSYLAFCPADASAGPSTGDSRVGRPLKNATLRLRDDDLIAREPRSRMGSAFFHFSPH